MNNNSKQTVTSTSATTADSTIQLMEQIKKEYKARKNGKTFNESPEGLKKRMAVLAGFLKTYNEYYCQGVVDAVSATSISPLTELWMQTVEGAFKHEKGSADNSSFCVIPEKPEMSESEYSMYAFGFQAALGQYQRNMDFMIKSIEI